MPAYAVGGAPGGESPEKLLVQSRAPPAASKATTLPPELATNTRPPSYAWPTSDPESTLVGPHTVVPVIASSATTVELSLELALKSERRKTRP
jgi:hypothetical protein